METIQNISPQNLSPQNLLKQNLSNNKTYQNKTYQTTKLINLQNISKSKPIKKVLGVTVQTLNIMHT